MGLDSLIVDENFGVPL